MYFILPQVKGGEVHVQPRDQNGQIEPVAHLGREITVDRQGQMAGLRLRWIVQMLRATSQSQEWKQKRQDAASLCAYPIPALLTALVI